MRRQPKARSTKEKARIERFSDLTNKVNYKGTKTKTIELGEVSSSRMGDVIVEFDEARLSFGNKTILNGFSYAFNKGEKIGLVGPNGAGKTTLIKTILGQVPLDAGWVSVGETVSFGYYSQVVNFRDPTQRVVDYVKEIEGEAKDLIGGFAGQRLSVYTLLERFNFTDGKQAVQIGALSGGEQRRLQMLTVLALCPNFLILDEPTNDLDLDTIEALEDMLSNFDGCVLIVSHDRQFVNNLADHIFVFDGEGGISDWSGSYSELRDYVKKQEQDAEDKKIGKKVKTIEFASEEDKEAAKEEEKRKRELLREAHNAPGLIAKIEKALEVLDKEITTFDSELFNAGADVSKALEIQKKKDAKVAKQELYYAEWERLEGVLAEAEEMNAEQI
jgi:ABC-type multidrug transport system ATPase subunit